MIADNRIAVHRFGRTDANARVVLLVHGLTDAGTSWPDLVAHWAEDYRIVAPDLRGHGESPRFTPEQFPHTAKIMLDDVLELVDQEPDPVVLIGHSLGGNLALHAALARPEKVRALIVEDPAVPSLMASDSGPDPEFVAQNEAFLDTMRTEEGRAAAIERMACESPWSRTEIEAWAACKPLVDIGYIRGGMRLAKAPWEETFQSLTVPTLLVIPDPAPMAPRAEAVTNPLVQRVVIPEAGHCVRRDQPMAFHAIIDAFLADFD